MIKSKNTTVKALIELLPWKEDQGRKTPIDCKRNYYRPDHQFPWMEENVMYMGQVNFPGNLDVLSPGESAEVIINLCSYPELDEKLEQGTTWRVKEGTRTVAKATLLEIINM